MRKRSPSRAQSIKAIHFLDCPGAVRPAFFVRLAGAGGNKVNELERLRKERADELANAKVIAEAAKSEDRDLTDEETEQIEAHTQRAVELRDEIETAETAAQRKREALAKLESEEDYDDQTQEPVISRQPGRSSSGLPSNPVGGEDGAGWRCFGEFLHDVRNAAIEPGANGRLERKIQAAATGLGTIQDSDLGFIIPPQFATTILEHMHTQGTVFNLNFTRVRLQGNRFEWPYINETSRADGSRWGGVQGYWVGEGEAPTATDPETGQLELKLHKAGCLGYISDEGMEDAPASGDMLERTFAKELLFKVEDALVRGNGLKKPLGFLNSPCKVEVDKETNQTAATIWGPNVTKMYARRSPGAAANAVWLYNQDIEPYLYGLTIEGRYGSAATSAEGIPLFYPAGTVFNGSPYGMLAGRPAMACEFCNTLGTAGDLILVDPTQYVVATKRVDGIKVDSSIHVRFTQGEKTFRAFYRIDGRSWWSSAMTPYQGTDTISPIIALAVRA